MGLKCWLQEKLSWTSRGDGLTCEERMLKLMTGGEWVSTDELHAQLKDYRDAKYQLKKRGYLFERKYEGKNTAGKQKKGTQYKTFYRLAGRIPCVPASKGKRGYMKDFSVEELVSELWARGSLGTMVANNNIYHVIQNYDESHLTPPCVCDHACSK